MILRSVIFDLDGTLVDSLDDITASLNHVLAARGLPTHGRDAVEQLVGDGARALVERAIPGGEDTDAILSTFRAYYMDHLTDHTRVYDGVTELLDELARRGVPTAVLSNKPHAMTQRVVATFFGGHPFTGVLGQRDGVPKKPDPTAARELAGGLTAPIGFVGDTPVDVATALAAGQHPIAVSWGMRDPELLRQAGAEATLGQPSDLLALLA